MHASDCEDRTKMIIAESLEPLSAQLSHSLQKCVVRYRSLENGITEVLIVYGNKTEILSFPDELKKCVHITDFPVVDSYWCHFPSGSSIDEEPLPCLCIAGNQIIEFIASPSNSNYTVSLPFKVSKTVPTSLGLLIKRDSNLYPGSVPVTTTPHLFSLSHPYNELLPVIYKYKDDDSSSHYVWDSSEVVFVSALDSSHLLLGYNKTSKSHSLLFVRKATELEWKCAASKAEASVSFLSTASPMVSFLHSSTPVTQSAPRTSASYLETPESWTPQPSVRTRSMTAAAALIQSIPFPSTPKISALSHSYKDSPVFRFSRIYSSNHSTPRISSLIDDSTLSCIRKGPDIDVLAPEICVECIWQDHHIRRQQDAEGSQCAQYAFITHDVIGQSFVCMFVETQRALKCIRIKSNDKECTVSGQPLSIECLSAANIQDRPLMAIVDRTNCTVLYSGMHRLGIVYGSCPLFESLCLPVPDNSEEDRSSFGKPRNLSICGPVTSVSSSFNGCIVLRHQNAGLYLCKLPPVTAYGFVGDCLESICSMLPNDKALRFSASWYLNNYNHVFRLWRQESLSIELALFIQFTFSQCGLSINDFPVFKQVDLLRRHFDENSTNSKRIRRETVDHSFIWNYVQLISGTDKQNIRSPFRRSFISSSKPEKISYTANYVSDSLLSTYALLAFAALHDCYEDAKVDTRLSHLIWDLTQSLHAFARIFNLSAHCKYYETDFPILIDRAFSMSEEDQSALSSVLMVTNRFSLERVQSFHENVLRIVNERDSLASFAPHRLSSILVLLAVGLKRIEFSADLEKALGKCVAKKLNISTTEADRLSSILNSSASLSSKCEQCASLFNISRGTLLHIPPSLALMICDILYSPSLRSIPYLSMESNYQPSSLPTPDELQIALRLRWPDDLRFNNATQMLDSSRPIFIPSRIQGTLTDAEHHELQDQLLAAVASRTMAQTFGRAAIELRTRSPLLNRPLDIPTVCLQGRVHPTNAPLDLSQTEMLKTMIEWSSYYSGVAAGLRLPDSTCLQLHSEWLSMSASCQQSNVSAGLMLAFGLNGHITNMNLFTIHELLTANDRLMSISILLGYAVSRRGTADLQVYKMVVTHLPFLMGPTLLELHIDPMVQTAALVSLGLLFACTSHIGIINQLINEIGRSAPPEQEPSVERYSYSLAAGFAIGLIALGKGDDLSTDVPFAENIPSPVSRLVVLMEGGRRSQCVFPVSGMNEYRNGSHPSDHRTSVPQSNHAKESENVNIHLTGGAAAVALGLVYLRTSNKWAANCLKIPSTLLAVETIRPDLLLIRTVARSLVLWDDIRGSVEWVEAQVPSIILIHKKRIFSEESRHLERHDWSVDDETVAQGYLCTAAGACFALALRFASTNNAAAYDTIMYYISMVLPAADNSGGNDLTRSAGHFTSFLVINTLVYSLGVLMAGSGNLQVLRLCRHLRSLVTLPDAYRDTVLYSTHIAASTTIGLLFLGGARYGLSTSDIAVASLVIAFFPVCPHNISDNRLYLQPLRYLWTIAAEERLISPLDSETQESVPSETHLFFKGTSATIRDKVVVNAPCVLPELKLLDKVMFTGSHYEKRTFHLRKEDDFAALEKILKEYHGRILMCRIGRRNAVDIASYERKGVDRDLAALSITEFGCDSSPGVSNIDFSLYARLPRNLPILRWSTSVADLFELRFRDYQMIHGSLASQDYLRSFLRDIANSDCSKFHIQQLQEMSRFLKERESESESAVLSSELIEPLNNM